MDIKQIGGYFEWEFPLDKNFSLHENAVLVNSGKHALEYILRGLDHVDKLYIPYYTCIDIVYPIRRLNIQYEFYHINHKLEIAKKIKIKRSEYIIVTNYFGIKDEYVRSIYNLYGDHLIVDNAQALWSPAENRCHYLYSPRKCIGMPDGGIVVSPIKNYGDTLPLDKSYNRCSHLLKRWELSPAEGYDDYKENGRKNIDTPLCQMSILSRNILMSVDLESIRLKRKKNFECLHNALHGFNALKIPDMDSFAGPMVYPLLIEQDNIRKKLILSDIFVATYWPNVFNWCEHGDLEYALAKYIIPLPCDQRYDITDMRRIVDVVINILKVG